MAYTQKFARPSLGRNGEPFIEKGLITPTDPKPNGVVASSDDMTFGSGVRNELPAVTLGTVKNTKPVTEPSNREKSEMLRKQIIAGTGDLLDASYLPNNPNIKQTTANVTKNTANGKSYTVTQDTFQNTKGGTPTVVESTPSNISLAGLKTQYYSSPEAQTQVANSINRQNTSPTIPGTSTASSRGRQNYMTRVTGGGDTGLPLVKEAQNVLTGDILGQISSTGRPSNGGFRAAQTGFYAGNRASSNTPQLDGNKRYINVTRNMSPKELQSFVKQDSLSALDSRRSTAAFVKGMNFKNQTFMSNSNNSGYNVTSGKRD